MIQIRVMVEPADKSGFSYYPETIYLCKKCETPISFYSISPHECRVCDTPLPKLHTLKNDIQARKDYHIKE